MDGLCLVFKRHFLNEKRYGSLVTPWKWNCKHTVNMGNLLFFVFIITSSHLFFARNIIPAPVEPEPAKFSQITRAKLGDSFCLEENLRGSTGWND